MPDAAPAQSNVVPFPQGGAGGGIDALMDQLQQKMLTRGDPNVGPIKKQQGDIQKQIDQTQPPPQPELAPINTHAPAAQVTDIFKQMGSPMMLMALLGGALTGAPITAALNNAKGYLNGIHQGDAEATKNSLDEFNANLDAAKEANSAALEKYKAAFDGKNFDLNKLTGKLRAAEHEEDNVYVRAHLADGRLDELFKFLEARQQNQRVLQDHQDQVNNDFYGTKPLSVTVTGADGKTTQQAATFGRGGFFDAETKEPIAGKVTIVPEGAQYGKNPKGAAFAAFMEAHPDATPEQQQAFIAAGSPPRSAAGLAIRKFMDTHPDATDEDVTKFAADYGERVKAAKDWGTGPLGNQTRSFSVGLYHLDTLQKLADALKNGDLKAFNKLANDWHTQTGNPAPTNFETAKQIIGAEVVKAIVGAGGGGVAERLEAANHISGQLGPDQLSGAIDTTKELMVGQLKGLKSQYERTTKLDDFEQTFLSPEARELFDAKATGGAGAQKFENGKIYTDANGNRAKYQDGKWIEQ